MSDPFPAHLLIGNNCLLKFSKYPNTSGYSGSYKEGEWNFFKLLEYVIDLQPFSDLYTILKKFESNLHDIYPQLILSISLSIYISFNTHILCDIDTISLQSLNNTINS